jgi:hypothetical protein
VQVFDVPQVAGDEVIDADDLVAFGEKSFAQVRTDEAGSAGDEGAHSSLLRIGANWCGLFSDFADRWQEAASFPAGRA